MEALRLTHTFGQGLNDFTTTQYNDSTLDDTLTGLVAGTYTVTVIDANGCQATIAVTVATTGCPTISIIPTVTNVTCYGASDGSISVTIEGGTAPYTFDWSGPDGFTSTLQNLTDIAAGTYTLIVTDAHNCQGSQAVTVTQPAKLVVLSQSLPNGTLEAAYSYDLLATGGTAPYTWSIISGSLPADLTLDPTTGVISGRPEVTGTYTFTVEVMDASVTSSTDTAYYCTATQELSITICPAIIVTASSTPVSQEGASDGSITLSVVGGAAPYSYFWTGPNDFTTTQYNDSTLDDTLTGLIAGTYTVTVIDANGCQATIAVSVGTTGCPTISVIPTVTNVTCYGASDGSISVTIEGGTAPYTFDWSGPDGFTSTYKT